MVCCGLCVPPLPRIHFIPEERQFFLHSGLLASFFALLKRRPACPLPSLFFQLLSSLISLINLIPLKKTGLGPITSYKWIDMNLMESNNTPREGRLREKGKGWVCLFSFVFLLCGALAGGPAHNLPQREKTKLNQTNWEGMLSCADWSWIKRYYNCTFYWWTD